MSSTLLKAPLITLHTFCLTMMMLIMFNKFGITKISSYLANTKQGD